MIPDNISESFNSELEKGLKIVIKLLENKRERVTTDTLDDYVATLQKATDLFAKTKKTGKSKKTEQEEEDLGNVRILGKAKLSKYNLKKLSQDEQ